MSGVGCSTRHDDAAATTSACLRAEVAVERGLGHAGAVGDLLEGHALDAVGEHEVDGGGQRRRPLPRSGPSHTGESRSATLLDSGCDGNTSPR